MKLRQFILLWIPVLLFVEQYGQEIKEKTIYVNQKNNVHLFFDTPIKSGITGSETYVFAYNTEQKEKIGILKAVKSEPTNLLVITEDGYIFSFILEYKEDITVFNYFIHKEDAIGNLESGSENQVNLNGNNNHLDDNASSFPVYENKYDSVDFKHRGDRSENLSFKENCLAVIRKGKFFKRFYASNEGVRLTLCNLVYLENYYYFFMEISNETKVDYDLNFMDFYISTEKVKARSSSQKIIYKPDYVFNPISRVNGNSKEEFVYVMKKFTVSDKKVLLIEMDELKGERNMTLEIPQEIINNPN